MYSETLCSTYPRSPRERHCTTTFHGVTLLLAALHAGAPHACCYCCSLRRVRASTLRHYGVWPLESAEIRRGRWVETFEVLEGGLPVAT
jgi:hypothetical protein